MTSNVDDIPTPALLVEESRLRANVQRMAATMTASQVSLRPHWKTSKSGEIGRMQLEAGAVGLTCATATELRALVDLGVEDVFWAYPPVGPARVNLAVEMSRRIRLRVGADSVASASGLGRAAAEAGTVVNVVLEIDTGLNRTGVAPDVAADVAGKVANLPGVRFTGVFMHEGQVGGTVGTPDDRAEVARSAAERLVEAAEAIVAGGVGVSVVSVGSTPGVAAAPFVAGVTEARPGTYVLGDDNQYVLGSIPPEGRALSVLCTVVSRHRAGHVIVDAGTKAMASDGGKHAEPRLGTTADGSAWLFTANEEHGYLTGPGVDELRIGERIRLIPNHACATVNMWSAMIVADGGEVMDSWPILARH